ncbi:MAG: hypothetical protein ABIG11_10135, partial [bacterium]
RGFFFRLPLTAYRLPLTVLFFCLPSSLPAQSISMSAIAPGTTAVLGTPLNLELQASYPEGFSLRLDTASARSDSFALLKLSSAGKRISAGTVTERMTLEVLPLDIGISTFPSLAWIAVPESAAMPASAVKAFSPPIPMEIAGVAPSGCGKEIKDIRPPVKPFQWPGLLAALLLAAVAVLALFIYRRHLKSSAAGSECRFDGRQPDAIALEALNELLASGAWDAGRFREFYEKLAEILRLYVEKSMGIPAPLMNTSDLARKLRKRGIKLSDIGNARSLLETCDLVKFAKLIPSDTEKDRDCSLLRKFVEATRPAQTAEKITDVRC